MLGSNKGRTVIGESMTFVGKVTAEGIVEVYGRIEGEMRCPSLIVTRNAVIAGSIKADKITVDGTVEGPIECGEIILTSHARVAGDVQCRTLVVEKGALIEGKLRHLAGDEHDEAKRLVKPSTTPANRQWEGENPTNHAHEATPIRAKISAD